jgi:hypothetical protein
MLIDSNLIICATQRVSHFRSGLTHPFPFV